MEGDRYAATPRSRREPGVAADPGGSAARPADASERAITLATDGGGRLWLAMDRDACVRVRIGRDAPPGEVAPTPPGGVTNPLEAPATADAPPWQPARLRRLDREDGLLVVGAPGQRARLEISRAPLRVRVVGRDGAPLTALEGVVCEADGGVRADLALPRDAHLRGAGDAPGGFERRGARLRAGGGAPGRFPLPFLLVHHPGPDAPAAWGVLALAPPPRRVELDADAGRPNALGIAAEDGDLDLWILPGPRPADVLARLAERLGGAPLPPRWALRHHMVTDARTVRAVERLARRARKRGMELGALHHRATARASRLARGGSARAELAPVVAAHGLRSVVRVEPDVRVDPDDPVYRDGLARGVFVRDAEGRVATRRGAARPDLARADAWRWWSEHHRARAETGASGFWSPPASPLADRGRPANGAGEPGLHGTRQAAAARRALEAARHGARPFVLAEAGGPGVTREAALALAPEPEGRHGLRARIPRILSLSLSGAAFCGVDLCDAGSPELVARAVQIAALQPLLRSRGRAAGRVLLRGSAGTRADAIAREAFALRARLLPYLYGLLRAAEETGAPVWRPLFYAFPEDAAAAGVDDQFLVGTALLAAPVCTRGTRERDVYLPPGDWYAWHDHGLHRGPRTLRVAAPLERLPLFVRAGALIPTEPPAPDDAAGPTVPTLEVFPGHDGALDWTEDDGETLAYRDGALARTSVRLWSRAGGRLRVELGRREGSWRPATPAVRLLLHACPPPRRVLLDGAPLHDDTAAPDGPDAPRYRVGNGWVEIRLPDVDRGAAVEVEPRP